MGQTSSYLEADPRQSPTDEQQNQNQFGHYDHVCVLISTSFDSDGSSNDETVADDCSVLAEDERLEVRQMYGYEIARREIVEVVVICKDSSEREECYAIAAEVVVEIVE
jgi:hypothetical protein